MEGSAEEMVVDSDGTQLFGLQKSIKDKAGYKHVLIIDFAFLPDESRGCFVFLVDNVEMDIGLEESLHM